MSAHRDMARRAQSSAEASGFQPVWTDLGSQACAVSWEAHWGGEVDQPVAITCCLADGLRTGQSVHLSLIAMTLDVLPELKGTEGWVRFTRCIAARLTPLEVTVDDITGRLFLAFEQVLHPSAAFDAASQAHDMAYLAQFIVPLARRFDPAWQADEGQALADLVFDQALSRGVLT